MIIGIAAGSRLEVIDGQLGQIMYTVEKASGMWAELACEEAAPACRTRNDEFTHGFRRKRRGHARARNIGLTCSIHKT